MLSSSALLRSGRSKSRKIRNGYGIFSGILWNCWLFEKNAQIIFVINFPISICLYLLQIKRKYHENKITVIREGEWRIHRKMSQWLWNPSSLNFCMNFLATTPTMTVSCNTQLWLWVATPSCDCHVGETLWVWDMCVFHIMICI